MKYLEKFDFFKKKEITQEDIDLVGDLFLEISDGLKEVDFADRYDMMSDNYIECDSFTTHGVVGSHIEIIICLSFFSGDGNLGGISWLSDEVEQKQKILNKKIIPFIERLKKFKFKVSIDIPESEPNITKLRIYR